MCQSKAPIFLWKPFSICLVFLFSIFASLFLSILIFNSNNTRYSKTFLKWDLKITSQNILLIFTTSSTDLFNGRGMSKYKKKVTWITAWVMKCYSGACIIYNWNGKLLINSKWRKTYFSPNILAFFFFITFSFFAFFLSFSASLSSIFSSTVFQIALISLSFLLLKKVCVYSWVQLNLDCCLCFWMNVINDFE